MAENTKENKSEKKELNEKELQKVDGGNAWSDKIYCPNCKERVNSQAWVCPYCGKRL